MTKIEQLAQGVIALSEQNELLVKEASDLREQLDMLQKRAWAEEILVKARGANAPDGLRAATIEDFLAKRAQLENNTEIEKVAMFVDFLEESGGISLADDLTESRGDFTGWLADIA